MLLQNYIGEWGRYQAYVYALLLIPGAIAGAQTMLFVFTGAVPKTRCYLKGLDGEAETATGNEFEFMPGDVSKFWNQLFDKSVKQSGKPSYCGYCKDSLDEFLENGTITAANCTEDRVVGCDAGFVFDRSQYKSSISMQFDMVCGGSWKQDVAMSMAMIGKLIGCAVFGTLSDRLGRKPTFMIASIAGVLTYNLTPFMPNLVLICLFIIMNGAFAMGAFLISFVVSMELIGGLPRTVCGIWIQGYFAVGYVWVGLLAYLVRDWKWLTWAVSIPSILVIPFWLLPESVRWLQAQGRTDEAKAIIMKAAKWNNLDVNPQLLEKELVGDMYLNTLLCGGWQIVEDDIPEKKASVLDLFRHKKLAIYTVIVFYTWFAVGHAYYGLSLNADDLPGSDYLNYLLLGLIEFPSYILCIPMVQYWGRRPTMVTLMGIGGLACIMIGVIPEEYQITVVSMAMIGKMCIAAAFAVIYNYSAEIFPTVVRNGGTGYASFCARIGSSSAPYVHILHIFGGWVPMVIYGLVSILAGVIDIFLPETKDKALPETLEDGVNFSKGREFGTPKNESPATLDKMLPVENGKAPILADELVPTGDQGKMNLLN